jgi:Na+-transporting methylmalonyl-CoA/oxaloacetate decarboxylase gamma subunit
MMSAAMLLASADRPGDPTIWQVSLIGFGSVFLVLAFFWLIIVFMQKMAGRKDTVVQSTDSSPAEIAGIPPEGDATTAEEPLQRVADDTCDLHDVDDATAAVLMAIVADELKIPPNELRFRSIRSLRPDPSTEE